LPAAGFAPPTGTKVPFEADFRRRNQRAADREAGAPTRYRSTVTSDIGRICVTGANGQLGQTLLRRLAATPGANPVAIVRSERAATTMLKSRIR
jgi:hypothetical protein